MTPWLPADHDVWLEASAADTASTFFQSPAWGELARSIDPALEPCPLVLESEGSGAIVFPAMRRRVGGGLFVMAESMPLAVYGGPLTTDDPQAVVRLPEERSEDLLAWAGGGAVVLEGPLRRIDLDWPSETRTTQVLPLDREMSEDSLLRGYRKGHRSGINRARREGVTTRVASSDTDFASLAALYDETLRRWAKAPFVAYGEAVFDWLATEGRADDRVRVLLAERGDEVVAAAVVLRHGRHAAYWIGATTEQGRTLNAGNLVVHGAIMDALRTGVGVFDFLPSGGLSNVERFKSGFGAETRSLRVFSRPPTWSYRLLRQLGNALRGARRARDHGPATPTRSSMARSGPE